jgi:hypothetical protein
MAGATIYNVRDFGAKGDGKTLDKKPFNPQLINALMKRWNGINSCR